MPQNPNQIFIPQQALAEIGKLHMELEASRQQNQVMQQQMRENFNNLQKACAERDTVRKHFDKLVAICTEAGIETADALNDEPTLEIVRPTNEQIEADVSAALDANAAVKQPA
jgi:uncharacterized coiled-coil DUF342 family protein